MKDLFVPRTTVLLTLADGSEIVAGVLSYDEVNNTAVCRKVVKLFYDRDNTGQVQINGRSVYVAQDTTSAGRVTLNCDHVIAGMPESQLTPELLKFFQKLTSGIELSTHI